MRVIYEDSNVLVVDKPAGIIVCPAAPEGEPRQGREEPNPPAGGEKTLIELLSGKYPYLKEVGKPPRYGVVHRLDKDTSGILLTAKNDRILEFLQNQFKERKVAKKYLALVIGNLKKTEGEIKTLIGRSPGDRRKQKVCLVHEPGSQGKREAVTKYKVLQRFKDYDLIEVEPKTGRKHQIRTHLSYLGHPVAGDKMYGFKNQPVPEGLQRHFLHASYLRIKLPDGKVREFKSELPEDLKKIIEKLR